MPQCRIPLASILISSFHPRFDFSWGFRSSAVLTQHIFDSCLPTFRDSPMVPSLKSVVRDCLLLNCSSSGVWNLLCIYLSILVDFCAFIFFHTLHLSTISIGFMLYKDFFVFFSLFLFYSLHCKYLRFIYAQQLNVL